VKKQKTVTEEQGERAPLWIISFADMISLLMAFFVMLLTMSTTRSGKLANEGEGIFEATIYGFNRAIEGFGVPGLFGGTPGQYGTPGEALYFDSHKTYYPISGGNETAGRTIDASEERIRRVFSRLGRHAKTYKSQLQWGQPDFVVTPIAFGQGQSALDEPAKQFLAKFTADLQESAVEKLKLYVVGLASGEKTESQQWMLSAKRAEAVADFVRGNLPAGSNWSVYSWGAGTGGDWVVRDSVVSGQSSIFIGVVRENQTSD
jgi:outer membrane protein OmpA-like peptidoglycan-associated protein